MKYIYGLALFCCIILWSSCRNDFETIANTGNLEFSRDTVYLDTVFTNIGSSTYNLKVYNRSDDDITIPTISLGEGQSSNYRLNVDGIPGKEFNDINILANDSIFVFVETTLDIDNLPGNDLNFLYTDQILFDTGAIQQKVELVTLVQDAVFLFPADLGNGMVETLNLGQDGEGNDILIEGFFLDDTELNWTNEKPYVIYGYAAVNTGKTLTVDAGARIHFHNGSGLLINEGGVMNVNGTPSADPELLENEVIFQGDRLEPDFENTPGQWGTIWFTNNSTGNTFTNATIKNSLIGLRVANSQIDLENVQIYNAAVSGLEALTGTINCQNMVINNCGQSSLAISLGGNYEFNHCTFANYWSNSFRSFPTVSINNAIDTGSEILASSLVQANFNNCIIYGNENLELGLFAVDDASVLFNYELNNTLLRFNDTGNDFTDNPLYQFDQAPYNNVVLNEDPAFFDPQLNDFNIEQNVSGAENIGDSSINGIVPVDLNGTSRATPPDAGAYESVVFPQG